jgi:hypothetical protein
MTTNTQRATLISSGEHIHAVCRLGPTYSAEQYLEAVELAREVGAGEAYADAVLGVDVDALLLSRVPDDYVVKAAEADLRRRGTDPDNATYQQYADALARVSP